MRGGAWAGADGPGQGAPRGKRRGVMPGRGKTGKAEKKQVKKQARKEQLHIITYGGQKHGQKKD